MIWVCGRSAPDLCRTSSQTSRKQNGWKLLETSYSSVTRIHCFWKTSSREMKPGATCSIRNQNCNRWPGVHRLPRDQKKSRLQKSKVKTLLISFFDNKDSIHKDSVPACRTVNAAFYQAVLNRLLQRIRGFGQSCAGLENGCCSTIMPLHIV